MAKETCEFCEGYQPEESGAGLREGCVTDELYEDEDCQVIRNDINDIVTAFMLGKLEKCPYFQMKRGIYMRTRMTYWNKNNLRYEVEEPNGDIHHGTIVDELSYYENAAEHQQSNEQEIVIKLPCKVDDTVYIITDDNCVLDVTINHFQIGSITILFWVKSYWKEYNCRQYCIEDFGKKVFPTREAAEQSLTN